MAQDLVVVRHELTSRIAALAMRVPFARADELAATAEEIRAIASAAGLGSAVTVLQFITAALGRGERGAAIHGWFPMLRDAVATDRQDPVARDAFAAACSVRLAA